MSLIVGFAVTVAIWPREVVSCCNFILRAVATFWAMLLVRIYPGRASSMERKKRENYSNCTVADETSQWRMLAKKQCVFVQTDLKNCWFYFYVVYPFKVITYKCFKDKIKNFTQLFVEGNKTSSELHVTSMGCFADHSLEYLEHNRSIICRLLNRCYGSVCRIRLANRYSINYFYYYKSRISGCFWLALIPQWALEDATSNITSSQ